ncbi:MAG: leucine-rich repeat domain-containing protein [Defluviitaleaceae bacterium]|nr:leucine-rich repeat domain-containing protein [Defluviitaleaceae bacterium]
MKKAICLAVLFVLIAMVTACGGNPNNEAPPETITDSHMGDDVETADIPPLPLSYITIAGERFDTSETVLFIVNTDLTNADIIPLRYMTNLTQLFFLGGTQISDLTPLAGLINLTMLDLNNNQISDLTPLAGLTNLEWLDLSGNPITDWSPVAHVGHVEGRL